MEELNRRGSSERSGSVDFDPEIVEVGADDDQPGVMPGQQKVRPKTKEQIAGERQHVGAHMKGVSERMQARARPKDKGLKSLGYSAEHDPRKSFILKKGLVGSIARFVAKAIGKGKYIERKKIEAKAYQELNDQLDVLRTAEMIQSDTRGVIDSTGASKYSHTDDDSDITTAVLPAASSIASARNKFARKPRLDKTTVAEAHVEMKPYSAGIEDIEAGDGNSWHCMAIRSDSAGNILVDHNAVVPTAERATGVSTDLNNVMVHINDKGHISIMTGVMDSKKRAKQFMAAVSWGIQERQRLEEDEGKDFGGPPKIRVSFHQLNAFGISTVGEKKLIEREHAMVDYIDVHLQDFLRAEGIPENLIPEGPVASHLNRTFNGFTAVPGEEGKNHKNNVTGMAIQMGWLAEDLATPLGNADLSGIGDGIARMNLPAPGEGQRSRLNQFTEARGAYQEAQQAVNVRHNAIREMKAELMELEAIGRDVTPDNEEDVQYTEERRLGLIEDREAVKEQIRLLGDDEVDKRPGLEQQVSYLNRQIRATNERLFELVPKSDTEQARIKKLKSENSREEKALAGELKTLARAMHALEQSLDFSDVEGAQPEAAIREAHAKLRVATHVLAIQTGLRSELGYPKLAKGQELQVMFLMDRMLGTMTQSNCKSTLDRNSHSRASGPALDQKAREFSGDGITATDELGLTYDFVVGFDQRIKDMDREWRSFHKKSPGSFEDFLIGQGASYRDVADFQAKMFSELMGVGRPMTFWSTGLEGFKWHHDKGGINPFEKNPHPMPYIPAQVYDSASKTWVTLVKIDSKGGRKLTDDGLALMMGCSQKRGA